MREMFVDCISDDIIYIHQYKSIFIDGKKKELLPILCLPSLCRFLITSISSKTENFLIHSSSPNETPLKRNLKKLLSPPRTYSDENTYLNLVNQQVEEFMNYTNEINYKIEKDTIEVMVGLKMIRNALIHQSWINNQLPIAHQTIEMNARIKFISKIGLPSDFMKFSIQHWDKIYQSHIEFSNFINIVNAVTSR